MPKEPVQFADPSSETLYRLFNPMCKHARTSFDILTCDACKDYTNAEIKREQGQSDQDNGEGFPSPY